MKRYPLFLAAAAVAFISIGGGRPHVARPMTMPAFLEGPTPWADSVLSTLSLDERIAQLMMVAAWSNKGRDHVREVEDLVRERNIGGLIFFQGGPARQAMLTNRYQRLARTPLLVGMDLEWGLAMRLDSTMRFPKQMTLGALHDDARIEAMGEEIARQMKRLGVQVSFSPVADVNNNPANPVINDRSFGEDRELVAHKSIAYMKGLQRGGVIATAKHFPGHGDTDVDSHLGLPLLAQTRARLDSLELYPFERMVAEGLSAMMVGHLEVPALDTTRGLPSTLSYPVVSDLLERELGFKGLIFTDALNMKGVANAGKPGEIELRALLAGNDVLLFPQNPRKAIDRIRQAVDSGLVPREMIDHKCLKLLRAKEWAGLSGNTQVEVEHIADDLNTPAAKWLRRSLYQEALTVASNNNGTLPISGVGELRIASLVIGDTLGGGFQRYLGRYARITTFRADKVQKRDSANALLNRLKDFDLVIASIHGTTFKLEKEFGIPQLTLDFLRRLGDQNRTAFVLFTNPYRLTQAYGAQRWGAVVCTYEENDDTQDLAAQLLFGGVGATGRLPVTASAFFASGQGVDLPVTAQKPLDFTLPEADGVTTADLQGIDAIVRQGLQQNAYPGCQVVVARDGHVLWNKAYGKTTRGGRDVRTDDVYDLASVTKVASTTLALMKLYDEGRIDLDRTLGTYLTDLDPKYPMHARLVLRDVLTHQAGLVPFVPYFQSMVKEGKLRADAFRDSADAKYSVRVAEGVYMKPAFEDSLWAAMMRATVKPRGEYVYSDLDFHLLARVVEKVSGMALNDFVDSTFYRPLGLSTTGYLPWKRLPKDRLMPTEDDHTFRMRLVQGDVHDQGAAMLGGVAGHAGLFSNASDMAVVMTMLVNGGTYNGIRYLSDSTVQRFTGCQWCKGAFAVGKENRRGLGWDKPQPHGQPGPADESVSHLSFGHTGFTGTEVWADPMDKTVYIFLSNRVNPDAGNKKLGDLSIRTRIQKVVHEAVAHRERAAIPGK